MKKFLCLLFALLAATQLTACASEAAKALQEAKRSFNNAEWADAKNYAQQIINNYPDTKAAKRPKRLSTTPAKRWTLNLLKHWSTMLKKPMLLKPGRL